MNDFLVFLLLADFGFHGRKSIIDSEDGFDEEANQREREARPDQADNMLPDYGDDYDDYAQKRRRKLFSLVLQETNNTKLNTTDSRLDQDQLKGREFNDPQPQPGPEEQAVARHLQKSSHNEMHLQQTQVDLTQHPVKTGKQSKPKNKRRQKKQKVKSVGTSASLRKMNPHSKPVSEQDQRTRHTNHTHTQTYQSSDRNHTASEGPTVAMQLRSVTSYTEIQQVANKQVTPQIRNATHSTQNDGDTRKHLRETEIENNMPLRQLVVENDTGGGKKWLDKKVKVSNKTANRRDTRQGERDSRWGAGGDFDGADDEDLTPAPVFDTEVNWSQTFRFKPLDLQGLRSDWIDLRCNVSGNLLLHATEVVPVVKAFMDQLNKKHKQ